MSFRHDFGRFHESVRVDGVDYTFEEFSRIPTAAERNAFRSAAVDRCVGANQRTRAAAERVSQPIREEHRRKREEFQSQPRFARRYAGRAQEIRWGLGRLRREQQDEVQEAVRKHVAPVDGNTYPAAVEDVFRTWEKRLETPHERLHRLLAHHDWYYEYSDDHRVWTAGRRRSAELIALVRQLGPEAQLLYNVACPWLNGDGSRKDSR